MLAGFLFGVAQGILFLITSKVLENVGLYHKDKILFLFGYLSFISGIGLVLTLVYLK